MIHCSYLKAIAARTIRYRPDLVLFIVKTELNINFDFWFSIFDLSHLFVNTVGLYLRLRWQQKFQRWSSWRLIIIGGVFSSNLHLHLSFSNLCNNFCLFATGRGDSTCAFHSISFLNWQLWHFMCHLQTTLYIYSSLFFKSFLFIFLFFLFLLSFEALGTVFNCLPDLLGRHCRVHCISGQGRSRS